MKVVTRADVVAAATGGDQGRQPAGWIAHPRRRPRRADRTDAGQRQAQREEGRHERWTLRRLYRSVTSSRRVAACGRPGLHADSSTILRVTDAGGTPAQHTTGATGRVAGFSGLFHCGSVWVCQECAARIAAHRAAELEHVLGAYVARGAHVVLLTLTMRHWREHPLAELLDARAQAWGKVTQGGTWSKHRRLTDFAGFVQVLEVTESLEHGWHPHVHAVLVFHSRPSDDALAAMIDGMWSRWSRSLIAAGLPAPIREHGLDVQHLDRAADGGRTFATVQAWARYVTKGIAGEAVLGPGKEAKGANRSVRQLMRDALFPQTWENVDTHDTVQTYDLRARAKLAEYEHALHGRRQMNWSRGEWDLRAGAGLDEEQKDEDVVTDDLQGEDVAVIPIESWPAVEPRAPELLAVAERQGPDAARAWLDALGVRWWLPTALTRHHAQRHEVTEQPPGAESALWRDPQPS